jgi:hypothetical protein
MFRAGVFLNSCTLVEIPFILIHSIRVGVYLYLFIFFSGLGFG